MGTRFGGLFREANSDAKRLDAFSLTDELKPLGWLNLDLFLAEKDGLVDSVVVVVVVVVVAAVPDLKDPRDRIRGRKRLLNRGDAAAVVGGAGLVLMLLPPRVLVLDLEGENLDPPLLTELLDGVVAFVVTGCFLASFSAAFSAKTALQSHFPSSHTLRTMTPVFPSSPGRDELPST